MTNSFNESKSNSASSIAEPTERSPLNPRASSTSTLSSSSSIPSTVMDKEDGEARRPTQRPSTMLYLAAMSALLGAIGMGAVLGWTAPAFDSMKEPDSKPRIGDGLDQTDLTWIGSSMTLGALVGALISGPMAQLLGRKKALIIYGIPFTVGWLTLAFANSVTLLIIGRIITGFSAGLFSGTAPSYVVEVSIISIRGFLGACFQLCVTIGILLVYVFGAFTTWNVLAGLAAIPTLLMAIQMFFMPETPNWLVSKGLFFEAEESLRKLRGSGSETVQELEAMQKDAAKSRRGEGFSFSDYISKEHGFPLALSLGLMFFQQFSGINAVMFYATSIFEDSGSSLEPKYATIIIGIAQVIATVIGSLLVDRLGRKLLLNISATLHVISLATLGAFYYYVSVNQSTGSLGWVPVVSLAVFIIGFSTGYGPIPWLMIAEITPMRSRSATSAMATAFNWTCAFLITKFFATLKEVLTKHGTFFMFALICFISILFVVFFLPETKGKSSQEIEAYFSSESSKTKRDNLLKSNNETPVEMDKLRD